MNFFIIFDSIIVIWDHQCSMSFEIFVNEGVSFDFCDLKEDK